jgi:acyl carrier protein
MSTNGTTEASGSFADFVELVGARINRPLDGVRPDDRLTHLGLDSIAMLELFVLLEDSAVHELPIDLVDSLQTLGDVWHWHTTLATQRGNGAELPDSTASHPDRD